MPQKQRPFATFFFPNLYLLPTPREKCRLKPRAHSGPKSAQLFRKVKGTPFQGIDFSTGLEKKTLQANDLTPMMWNEILPQGIH